MCKQDKDRDVAVANPASELAVYEPSMTMEKAVETFNLVTSFCKKALSENIDYGVIPGTEKPTLLKPGAEKLAIWFGLAVDDVDCKVDIIDTPKGQVISVRSKCILRDKQGFIKGISEANCNTGEDRYQHGGQWIPEWELPDDFDTKNADVKTQKKKAGGSFKKYRLKDSQNPWNFYNTVIKMSQKRAFVSATLMATGTSSRFTADMEDSGAERGTTETKSSQRVEPSQGELQADKDVALELAFKGYSSGKLKQKDYDGWAEKIESATSSTLPAMIKALKSLGGEK